MKNIIKEGSWHFNQEKLIINEQIMRRHMGEYMTHGPRGSSYNILRYIVDWLIDNWLIVCNSHGSTP